MTATASPAAIQPCTFVWLALMTNDPNAAEAFYRRVTGGSTADAGMPGMDYNLLSVSDSAIAGQAFHSSQFGRDKDEASDVGPMVTSPLFTTGAQPIGGAGCSTARCKCQAAIGLPSARLRRRRCLRWGAERAAKPAWPAWPHMLRRYCPPTSNSAFVI